MLPIVRERTGFGLSGTHDTVVYHRFGPVGTPLIHRDHVHEALQALFDNESVLPGSLILYLQEDGAIFRTLQHILDRRDTEAVILKRFARASLDTRRSEEDYLRKCLDRPKRKDLARLGRRLAECGSLEHLVHTDPGTVTEALARFMKLEASGWKGRRQTALGDDPGAAGIRHRRRNGPGALGQCAYRRIGPGWPAGRQPCELHLQRPAVLLEDRVRRGIRTLFAGSQVILALSKSLLGDRRICLADSLAEPDNPMIGHLWRDPLNIVHLLIPIGAGAPLVGRLTGLEEQLHDIARQTARQALARLRPRASKR